MGKNQGLNRYRKGVTRILTNSEVTRGYIFISKDRRLSELLNTANFVVEINGKRFENRKVDAFGRAQIPKAILAAIGTKRSVRINVESTHKVTIT